MVQQWGVPCGINWAGLRERCSDGSGRPVVLRRGHASSAALKAGGAKPKIKTESRKRGRNPPIRNRHSRDKQDAGTETGAPGGGTVEGAGQRHGVYSAGEKPYFSKMDCAAGEMRKATKDLAASTLFVSFSTATG